MVTGVEEQNIRVAQGCEGNDKEVVMGRLMDMFQRSRTRWGSIAVLAVLCLRLVGCSGADGPTVDPVTSSTGSITGQVVTGANNAPVVGATVRTSVATTTTGSDGKFGVQASAGDRIVVQIEADGYASGFPVARVRTGQTTSLGVKLLPVGVTQSVGVSAGGTVSVPGSPAQVILPADGLVPQNGGTAAGTVTVSVTPINPATNPSLMPGDFTGVTAGGGSNTPIESFGALGVDIRDAAGTRYTLASGKTATIRIPLGTLSPNPPATIPLWYFNETTGVWQEEGTATLRGTGANRYYEGPVVRFTRYWNADKATEVIFVSGCVTDLNGQSVPNMLVATTGLDYSGTASTVTKQDGTFRVAMRKDGKAKVNGVEISPQTFASRNATNVMTVGPSSSDITLGDCLVLNPDVVVITTNSPLQDGRVGDAYNQTLSAISGTPGYVWSLNAGSAPLPAGLSLNPTGVISGVPTTVGTTLLMVKVTDAAGGTATKPVSLTILPRDPLLAISTASPLPEGVVGTPYSAVIVAAGGTGTRSWSVVGGALPLGLNLDASTGVISGIPTAAGTSTVTIRVQDSSSPQQSVQKAFDLTVKVISTLTITTPSPLPSGTVGTLYSATVATVGGTGTLSWSVVSGSLPIGLTLNPSTGVISGTPTTAGISTVTVRVQDTGSPQQSVQKDFTITITDVPLPPECGTVETNCLTVTNAPASVGRKFSPNPIFTNTNGISTAFSIGWSEDTTSTHAEAMILSRNPANGTEAVIFSIGDTGSSGATGSGWICTTNPITGSVCPGLTVNPSAGTATFVNTVLSPGSGTTQSITLNGTLTFTPF